MSCPGSACVHAPAHPADYVTVPTPGSHCEQHNKSSEIYLCPAELSGQGHTEHTVNSELHFPLFNSVIFFSNNVDCDQPQVLVQF